MSERTKIGFMIGLGLAFAAAMSQCGPKSEGIEAVNKVNADGKASIEYAPSVRYELKK